MKITPLVLSILILMSCSNETSQSTQPCSKGEAQFEWDFSEKRKFIYSFSQTVTGENKMSKDEPAEKTSMTGKWNLNIIANEDSLADLRLTDIEMNMVEYNKDGTPKDTTIQKAPVNVVEGMRPDGSFVGTGNNIMFKLLLPLPNKKLEKGDSDEIPMQMPFNANGSQLLSKGQNTLTFTGCKEIEGRNCAVLKGEIDISKLDVPEELKGDYVSSTTGKGTYYFDLENGCYVGADIEMVMNVMMDATSEDQNGFGMYTKMKSKNVYKIRLEKIEE